MNNEAYKIRSEINRLKQRLLEIDKEIEEEESAKLCASNVCGQDVILDHIQKICRERGTEDISIMAAWSTKRGWYSTTIVPKALPYLLRDVDTIIDYIGEILEHKKLEVIQILSSKLANATIQEISTYIKTDEIEVEKILNELLNKNIVSNKDDRWSITTKGWHTYIAMAHISYNYTKKLDIYKAVNMAPIFKKVFHKEWGEDLEIEYLEVIEKLKECGEWESLVKKGITEEDIKKAVYESDASWLCE